MSIKTANRTALERLVEGQIGAGITAVPMECFVKALEAFAATRAAAPASEPAGMSLREPS